MAYDSHIRQHPNEKPVSLMAKLVELCTNPGDIVFDPFMGSGTTGVACVQLERSFIGCEISPEYFAIAEKRIKQAQLQMLLPLEMK
jgi:DNA modification methylase